MLEDDFLSVRIQYRSFITYIVFVMITTTIILNNTSSFWLNKLMEEQLLENENGDISDIRSLDDMWRILEAILLESYLWNHWYTDVKIDDIVNNSNKLLGVPRLRQLREKYSICPTNFKTGHFCVESYAKSTEDKSAFGLRNATAWTYYEANELGGLSYEGYSGGGFYQDLSRSREYTQRLLAELKENNWITRQTRVVFLDLVVYNANVQAFCIVRIIFELPATGGVIVFKQINTVKLFYATTFDYFLIACELVFFGFLIYYTRSLIARIQIEHMRYFNRHWRYLEFILIITGYVYMVLHICTHVLSEQRLAQLNNTSGDVYVNFEHLTWLNNHRSNIAGLLLFLVWIKLFKYVKLLVIFEQLNATFSRCISDMLGFLLTIVVFFVAYAVLGYCLFGVYVRVEIY